MKRLVFLTLCTLVASVALAVAQGSYNDYEENAENVQVDHALFEGMEFRAVGFSRGGRSTAATGVSGQPLVYYFGGTGGGVFKTTDAGNNWPT